MKTIAMVAAIAASVFATTVAGNALDRERLWEGQKTCRDG